MRRGSGSWSRIRVCSPAGVSGRRSVVAAALPRPARVVMTDQARGGGLAGGRARLTGGIIRTPV